ncbi:E3 ubiquitin-protein ligase FANCL isoform X3 [Vulpes lagopus]|uniref:E3 ubiquitin-protein ligase FANCL isoform X3 n=1 Tax=Vulpes lagopus TaxID=494514 RepID=UPI001BC94EDD|nr:E3 ubiquitin-protein ligase FANCL isoform X3 [Vulpes lagopus]
MRQEMQLQQGCSSLSIKSNKRTEGVLGQARLQGSSSGSSADPGAPRWGQRCRRPGHTHLAGPDLLFTPQRRRGFFPPKPSSRPSERGAQARLRMCGARPADNPPPLPLPRLHRRRTMAEMEASLLRQFPLLLPQNRAKTVYEGFISAQYPVSKGCIYLPFYQLMLVYFFSKGRDFHLKILLPEDLQMKNARLLCSWQLKTILNGYHQIVQQRMQHSPDLMSFMMELKMVLEVALKNKQELYAPPPPPQFYSSLMEEIGTLGWDKLVYVDTCLSTIKLKAEDASGRKHLITLKLKTKYPTESPDCVVDFPVSFSVSWTPQHHRSSMYL